MPIKRLRGRREAHTVSSEMYKEKLIEYLESRGFYILSSSAVESDLPDLIFQHKFQENTNWMEIKATSINLNNSDFLAQLGNYLSEYLIRSNVNKFKFWIAAYRLNSPDLFNAIYEDFNREKTQEIIKKIIEKTTQKSSEIIEKYSFEDIAPFFETTEIIEAEPFDLQTSKEKITPTPRSEPKLSDVEYAAQIMSNYDMIEPVLEEHKGYTNLFPIILPDFLYLASSPYSNVNQIFKENELVHFPPFILKNKEIISFDNLDDSILRRYVNVHTIYKISTKKWISQEDNRINDLLFLLNKWINETCRNNGMKYDRRTRSYFFPKNKTDNKPVIRRWMTPQGIDKSRKITKPYYKNNIINFWAHKSAQIRSQFYWNEFFIKISPRWLFSENGVEILEGERADKLDRFFRKSNFNRNKNILYDTLFWYDLLFKDIRRTTLDKQEYIFYRKENEIQVNDCITFTLTRKPNLEVDEDIEEEIDLASLEEFLE